MMNNESSVKSERYSSRYTRGFLRMLTNEGQALTDKFVEQFYTSKNYQERLEAIKYLISVNGKYSFPEKILADALKDFCSQVKVYVLQHFNFSGVIDPHIKDCLKDIAKNDEKLQLRTLALERLSELDDRDNYDLFFSTSLLKGSKESSAGLRGLYKLDKEKAYQMAKFRTESSSGNLDIAIAEIFQNEGDINDLAFIKQRLKARNKFNKIELIRIYLRFLGRLEIDTIIRSNILFISEDILSTSNRELVQLLIMELHHFVTNYHDYLSKNEDLLKYLKKTIDILLEKKYLNNGQNDPFGPI
jgi:curved DNA-binding protein CbpA